MPEPTERYRRYWAYCDQGHPPLSLIVEIHQHAEPDDTIPGPNEWDDAGIRCPVCGETVAGGYEGADNATSHTTRRAAIMTASQAVTDVLRGLALKAAGDRAGVLALAARVDRIIQHVPEAAGQYAAAGRQWREEQG